ncbi:putative uncharacterized protein [Parachlamydia acanthamoebae UV-7]|uniref:Uncharacterized protein n=2 Tax=Parachlamydia acanthamoebae TaxID=83552 RepID=F8L264_PARAV|nr:hypothetical protein pah_c047o018 [Parachlamydia acanthamoebae str. Hall's coccus]KIA76891.1 hypothetical protein DB43_HD00170 [Parachlamydia acanthamoebae]CCB87395.1 putative uncharacterized protein [Parachlamydia acanthamoebae UV-7]
MNKKLASNFKSSSFDFSLRHDLISYFRTFRPFFEFIVRIPE